MRTLIALIVDDLRVRRWEAEALSHIAEDVEVLLLNCTNTPHPRRILRHWLYYLLNLISLRSAARAWVRLPEALRIVERIDFEAEADGSWQRLPQSVLQLLAERRPSLAIKFGMGLLRVPDEIECGILSYHHGDPRAFRGRPAGFYEMLQGVRTVGQAVQLICNRLDAGRVAAFGETRVQPHSYRGTMADSYRASPLLLKAAVRNCLSDTFLPFEAGGRNYRLPSNSVVLRFCAKLMREKVKRLTYGAFFEKEWRAASVEAQIDTLDGALRAISDPNAWRLVEMPKRYRFLADPFPLPGGGVAVEAFRRSDGQGEIVEIVDGASRTLCAGVGHFSYPAIVEFGGDRFLIPEVAEWSKPLVYRLHEDRCELAGSLDIDGDPHLLDATVFAGKDAVYLFANVAAEGGAVLRLWTAPTLFSRFTEHPDNPIRISPVGGRMAGGILEVGRDLYRLGQDNSGAYGRRITAFKVVDLSPSRYAESYAGELSLQCAKGPHTFNTRGGVAFFDFYRDRFSPLAGVRRLRGAWAKRKALASREPMIGAAKSRSQRVQIDPPAETAQR